MSKNLVLWSCATALFLACGKLFTITVESEDATVVEKGTLVEALVEDLGFSGFLDMDLTISEELENQGAEPGDVSGVFLSEFVLEVTDPADGDLSFLEDLAFFVTGEDLPTVKIASKSGFEEGTRRVDMDLEDVDLTDYVVAESMDIITEVEGHRPSEDTTVNASLKLEIGVTKQGVCNELQRRKAAKQAEKEAAE